jgi:hypothetical protein
MAVMLMFLLLGPVPWLLTTIDLSNQQLYACSLAALVPYWITVGVLAGWLCWLLDAPTPEKRPFWRISPKTDSVTVVVCAIALIGALINFRTTNYVRRGSAPVNTIINNLRQIDAAKQQLALDHSLSLDHVPTEVELYPYLGRRVGPEAGGGQQVLPFRRPWGERYVINPIGTPPFAILDSDYRVRRRGWEEGYTVPKGKTVRLQ